MTAAAPSCPSRAVRAVLWVDARAGRRSFLPLVGVFPALDYVAPFMPNQALMMVLAALRPARWVAVALTFAGGTALGAFLTALLIQAIAPTLSTSLFGSPEALQANEAAAVVRSYGPFALALLGLLPWPPRLAAIAAAASGLNPGLIGAAVLVGRIPPTLILSFLAARSPHLLRRWPRVEALFAQVEAARGADSSPCDR